MKRQEKRLMPSFRFFHQPSVVCFAIHMPHSMASFGKARCFIMGALEKRFILNLNWMVRYFIDIYSGIDGIAAIYLLR